MITKPVKDEVRRVRHRAGGDSMTRQSDALQSDVNSIVSRYIQHGVVDGAPGSARYGDFSHGLDYKTALDAVSQAEADFLDLPVAVRNHVENDPGKFLDLVMDPERKGELVELGLVPAQDPSLPAPAAPAEAPVEAPAEPAKAGEEPPAQ